MADGFSFANMRLPGPEQEPGAQAPLDVALPDPDDDTVKINPDTKAAEVQLPDGSVTVYMDGLPSQDDPDDPLAFYDNIADKIGDDELGRIANELLTGIAADEESRREWVESRAEGMKLLGLTLEGGKLSSSADGAAPIEGMSRYRHSLMLESVIRFQANARAELLPTDGPVKVRNDDPNSSPLQDSDANALERDMNHYLTTVDTAYYPDTARALWWTGFGGCTFKKVYHNPLKRRPVSESVDALDIIVSSSAVDIYTAPRVTHRHFMRKSMLKRMMIVGAYRNVELGVPETPVTNSVTEQKEAITGITPVTAVETRDRDYEIFETYCELDIAGFEHKGKDRKPDGLPVPYKVSIDKTSMKVLEVRRNWKEDDDLCMPINRFVKYSFIDALGFYGIGYVHILGSTTNAVTALAREMIDAGSFANFPGGLVTKGVTRQNNSNFRVGPGEFTPVDTNGARIQDAIMPFPYKEPGPAMFQLTEMLAESGSRLGNIAEISVGEGRQDAPVGTTIALIEQATKPIDAVHKGLHASQAMEFDLLLDRIREDPESFIKSLRRPAKQWDSAQLLRAINDYDLVPVADPNTSSRMQRIGKAQALYQMAKDNTQAFDQKAVYDYVFSAMELGSADAFLQQQTGAPPPDPKVEAERIRAQATAEKSQYELAGKKMDAQAQAENDERAQALETIKGDQAARRITLQSEADERQAQFDSAEHAHGLETMALGHEVAQAAHKSKLAEVKAKPKGRK